VLFGDTFYDVIGSLPMSFTDMLMNLMPCERIL